MNFDTLFANPKGRAARPQFTGALITLLAAVGFYYWLVPGRTGQFAMTVMLYPAIVLHARRLHDMGRTGWLLVVPGALMAAAAWFHLYNPEAQAKNAVTLAGLAVFAGFALWGLIGKGQGGTNRFGATAA